MKFIIRDDDINYHFQADQLEKWYSGIIDICPISVCIPAFVKGDFFKWVNIFENHLPYNQQEWLDDNKIYKIGENLQLVAYLKDLLKEGKIGISMHGIFHRNDEMEYGEVKNNFIRGAEFYTNRDYYTLLKEAKDYLSDLFDIQVCSFTPPQNMINKKGLEAVVANGLSLCTDPLNYRDLGSCLRFYGLINTLHLYYDRKFNRRLLYSYPFFHKVGFVFHTRLQPQLDINSIISEFDYTYKKNGVFVLSTHSYGFDVQMKNCDMTMKEALMEILHYSQKYDNVEYITLHELFSIK